MASSLGKIDIGAAVYLAIETLPQRIGLARLFFKSVRHRWFTTGGREPKREEE